MTQQKQRINNNSNNSSNSVNNNSSKNKYTATPAGPEAAPVAAVFLRLVLKITLTCKQPRNLDKHGHTAQLQARKSRRMAAIDLRIMRA